MDVNNSTSSKQQDDITSAKTYLEQGNNFRKKGELEEAAKCYRQAIHIQPDYCKAHYELGNVLQQQNKSNESVNCRFIAIENCPDFGPSYHKLVWADLNEEQLERATDCCKNALRASVSEERLQLIRTTIGDLLTKQGNLKEATKFYREAVYQRTFSEYPDFYKSQGPNFFVIGGMKCGSTSIYEYIVKHHQVIPALKKEIHFFNMNYEKGIDWYLSHFPFIPKDKSIITGEATPCLSVDGIWEKVYHFFPHVKLIAVLRNPVDRAYSHYNHTAQWFGVNHRLEDAIKHDLDNKEVINKMLENDPNAYRNVKSNYLIQGLYVYWLKEWLRYFPREQILIIKSEDLFTQTSLVMKQVFDFLNIPNHSSSEYPNTLKGRYSSMSESLRHSLNEYFKPHNQKLEDFLCRDLNWS